jgi:hypothetical protein
MVCGAGGDEGEDEDAGKEDVCGHVKHVVQRTWKQLRLPFVFCCPSGLKVLVLGEKDGDNQSDELGAGQQASEDGDRIIVAFCRSPLPDRANIAWVAQTLKLDFDALVGTFESLPVFGVRFLEAVAKELRAKNIIIPLPIWKEAENLANAYKSYEADISVYNGLRRMPRVSNKGFRGLIIDMVSQEADRSPLHRIITSKLDGPQGDRHIPILGFVITEPSHADGLREMLNAPSVKQASTVVAQTVLELRNNERLFERIEQGILLGQSKPRFFARVQLFSSCAVGPSKSLCDEVLSDVCLRLHIAAKTAPWRLVRVLDGDPDMDAKDRWREFCRLLGRFADERLHSPMFGNRQTVWSVVFADMQKAVEAIPAETYAKDSAFYLPQVRSLLDLLERFSILSPVSSRFLAIDHRHEMLEQELRRLGEAYSSEVRRELIPRNLARSCYSPEAVKEALAVNSDDTIGALLKAIAAEIVSLSDKSGGDAVRAVFDWYSKSPHEKDLPEVRAKLFDAAAPWGWRLGVNVLSGAAVAFVAGATMGAAPIVPMLRSLRSRAHKRFQKVIMKQEEHGANA